MWQACCSSASVTIDDINPPTAEDDAPESLKLQAVFAKSEVPQDPAVIAGAGAEADAELQSQKFVEESDLAKAEDKPEEEQEGERLGKQPESIQKAYSSVSLHGIDLGDDEGDAQEADEGPPSPSKSSGGRQPPVIHRSTTAQSTSSKKSMAVAVGGFLTRLTRSLTGRIVQQVPERPNFHGSWVCIATWGLDEFLKAAGISYVQRCAAAKASWPSWDFEQDEDSIKFCNHTMMGDISEVFTVGGPEYIAVDGRKQKIRSNATWEGSNCLLILRDGPQGKFQERRLINEKGELHFTLTGKEAGTEHSWGRSFVRKT